MNIMTRITNSVINFIILMTSRRSYTPMGHENGIEIINDTVTMISPRLYIPLERKYGFNVANAIAIMIFRLLYIPMVCKNGIKMVDAIGPTTFRQLYMPMVHKNIMSTANEYSINPLFFLRHPADIHPHHIPAHQQSTDPSTYHSQTSAAGLTFDFIILYFIFP